MKKQHLLKLYYSLIDFDVYNYLLSDDDYNTSLVKLEADLHTKSLLFSPEYFMNKVFSIDVYNDADFKNSEIKTPAYYIRLCRKGEISFFDCFSQIKKVIDDLKILIKSKLNEAN